MHEMKSKRSRFARIVLMTVVALACVTTLAMALGGHVTLAADDPVQAALEKAQAAGAYRYIADTQQTTFAPGSPDEHQSVHIEGEAILPDRSRARAWAGGGSVATGEGALELVVIGDQVWVYVEGEWQQVETDQLGLSGFNADTLALLEVADDPTFSRHEGGLEVYGFQVEGPRLAAYWQRMLDEQFRDELPEGVEIQLSSALRTASGAGELWIDPASGYPVRQTLELEIPDLGDGQSLRQSLDVVYSDFGADIPPIEPPGSLSASDNQHPASSSLYPEVSNQNSVVSSQNSVASDRTSASPASRASDSSFLIVLLSMLIVAGLFRLGRKRAYLLLALFVSGSLVLTPPLQGVAQARQMERLQARLAPSTSEPNLRDLLLADGVTPADYNSLLPSAPSQNAQFAIRNSQFIIRNSPSIPSPAPTAPTRTATACPTSANCAWAPTPSRRTATRTV